MPEWTTWPQRLGRLLRWLIAVLRDLLAALLLLRRLLRAA